MSRQSPARAVLGDKGDNMSVSPGWRYQCKSCGYQVGIETAFPEKCPGCGAAGWWGRLTTMETRRSINQGVVTATEELCHREKHSVMGQPAHSRAIPTPTDKGNGRRGPKFRDLPEEMIREMASMNYGPTRIAQELREQGIEISPRTISRRLHGNTEVKHDRKAESRNICDL